MKTKLSIFATDLGWFGLRGDETQVTALSIGHESAAHVRLASSGGPNADDMSRDPDEFDWHPDLRRQLQQFAAGERVDFTDVELALPCMTEFQQRVIAATRRVGYGTTVTYGELAVRSGYRGAARAVGSVMSSNRFPIIVPCHRVVAAGGRLGGFSSPRGVSLKQQMLDLESQHATELEPAGSSRRSSAYET